MEANENVVGHKIVLNLDPGLGGPFLCSCGRVLVDAAAGIHHLLNPDELDGRDAA